MSSHLAAVEHIEETLKKEGRLVISAVGYSMLPLISPNSSIEIQKCDEASLKLGDILLVKRNNSFILHRLCEIRFNNRLVFITKGDNARRHDTPVEGSMVLGKVVAVGSSKFKKRLWHFANQVMIVFTFRAYAAYKHLSQKKWYKALSGVRAFFVKRKSLVFPIVTKLGSLPLALAHSQQKLHYAYQWARVSILLPKTHIVKFLPADSADAAGRLWERVFPELRFESHESLKYYLFFHFLSNRPICFLAMNKDRCVGLISTAGRFPTSRGQFICSLEALAADPDFKRKGVGSALLDRLKGECQNQNIAQITTCRNKIFFPGLQPEHHGQAIDFLVHYGFESPRFMEEMILTSRTYKKSESAKRIKRQRSGKAFSFGLLKPSQKMAFLEFLKQKDYALFDSYSNCDWSSFFESQNSCGIFLAEQQGKIIGCIRYDALLGKTGPAHLFRGLELSQLPDIDLSRSYILNQMFVPQTSQHPEIRGLFFASFFDYLFADAGRIAIWDTQNASFFSQFGARKMNAYLSLHAQISTPS